MGPRRDPGSREGGGSPSRSASLPVKTRVRALYALLGVAALLVVWELLSLWVDPIFIASPVDTAKALGSLAAEGTLWTELLITLKRLVVGGLIYLERFD